ncbi:interleukin-1 beta [Callorhinchus milii]|uniref:interleukin-1 beta n=1 Tax=Callorhinchus milii TaxID=7868 RepID=UPI0004573661|nr:interleukin-1 beta [Callorhinchus milii]|eukprot:gi/632977991/ref/XP_007905654.1/ PREDICTED: interleukin-1 beta-like [Callorhinchus milii]
MRTEGSSVSVKPNAGSETVRSPIDLTSTHKSISSNFVIKNPSGEASVAVADSSPEMESYQLKMLEVPGSASVNSKPARSLQKVFTLVLAVEKFKKMTNATFKDSDLLGFNHMIEEAITRISYDHSTRSNSSYRFWKSESRKVRDYEDKCLVLSPSSKLIALFLQTTEQEVTLDIRHYRTFSGDYQPVVLGIRGKNMFLSCTKPHANPELQVEEWNNNLNDISSATKQLRFVFFKKVSDMGSTFEFESANHRGWYISTSKKNRQTVEMEVKEKNRITVFTVSM